MSKNWAPFMWLESITVRTADLEAVQESLSELLAQLSCTTPSFGVHVLVRYPASSDLSLHLHHEYPPLESSVLGLRLAEALRAFGTVDHALWQHIELANRSQ